MNGKVLIPKNYNTTLLLECVITKIKSIELITNEFQYKTWLKSLEDKNSVLNYLNKSYTELSYFREDEFFVLNERFLKFKECINKPSQYFSMGLEGLIQKEIQISLNEWLYWVDDFLNEYENIKNSKKLILFQNPSAKSENNKLGKIDAVEQLNIILKGVGKFIDDFQQEMNTPNAQIVIDDLQDNLKLRKALSWFYGYGYLSNDVSLEKYKVQFERMHSKLKTEIWAKIENRFLMNEVQLYLKHFFGLCYNLGIDSPKSSNSSELKDEPKNKKSYALYHWIMIDMGRESEPQRRENRKYNAKAMKEIFKKKYPKVNPDTIYKAFANTDITKKELLIQDFGKSYKEDLIIISNSDSEVIRHLKSYPN